jgi:hypothetical protein
MSFDCFYFSSGMHSGILEWIPDSRFRASQENSYFEGPYDVFPGHRVQNIWDKTVTAFLR